MTAHSTRAPSPTMDAALLDSRQRWRAFGALATDLAFETDAAGRLLFIAPDGVLGWPAASLLGRPAAALLAGGADPFAAAVPIQGLRTTLRAADGGVRCFAVSAEPMADALGRFHGVRGIGVDITMRDRADAQAAASMRRGEVLGHILSEIRQELLTPRMMEAALMALMRALGASGAAVLDLRDESVPYAVGSPVPERAHAVLQGEAAMLGATEGQRVLACPASTRFGERAAVVAWCGAAGREWDNEDLRLAEAIAGIVRIVLEHEAIQRQMAAQARTDPLTGLLNRRAFLEDSGRRLDRLDREGQPGTLLLMDLDGLKHLNSRAGHEAGDAALMLLAALLRRTFRPTDLLARLGGDEFALWMDNADELTAAERAEHLRLTLPTEAAHLSGRHPITLSTGIACRRAGWPEDLQQLLGRAGGVLHDVKQAGGAGWRVCHAGGL